MNPMFFIFNKCRKPNDFCVWGLSLERKWLDQNWVHRLAGKISRQQMIQSISVDLQINNELTNSHPPHGGIPWGAFLLLPRDVHCRRKDSQMCGKIRKRVSNFAPKLSCHPSIDQWKIDWTLKQVSSPEKTILVPFCLPSLWRFSLLPLRKWIIFSQFAKRRNTPTDKQTAIDAVGLHPTVHFENRAWRCVEWLVVCFHFFSPATIQPVMVCWSLVFCHFGQCVWTRIKM